jgi:transketolase
VGRALAAYGWNVIGPVDGHDVTPWTRHCPGQESTDKPTLIVCKTHIGKGSPNRANTAKAHGEPLGAEEIKLTREALGWTHEPFVIPEDVYAAWDAKAAGQAAEAAWDERFAAYKAAYPELAAEFVRRMKGELPADFAPDGGGRRGGRAHQGRNRGQPQGQPDGAGGFTAACPNCWAAAPT